VFKALADAQTPQGIAAEIAIPKIEKMGDCVFLEGVQDPSNVGAIVRSAAAFGVGEVVLDRACADPWSPKALRAGMGGHFRIGIRQDGDLLSELEKFDGALICTAARGGQVLGEAVPHGRLGWVFGSEAHGVSSVVQERAHLKVCIPMDAGWESLNVAAAAAICLYEAFRRKKSGSDPDFEFSRPGAGS
jgi:TrmH family RNA methyltransferase